MDIRLDDGTIIRNVPDGMTKEQVQAKVDAKRARDSGTTGGDYLKALASGVNRIGASIAGSIDNSIVGDVARLIEGAPTKKAAMLESPTGSGPWTKEMRDAELARMDPERRARAEAAAAEYLKASPITKDIQQFFSDNADYWNKDQSKGAQAKREYVGGATGIVDALRRYRKEPQAALLAATENVPQIGVMAVTRKAPASAQLTLGAIGEAQMNAEDARQSVLADAKQKGASASDAVAASQRAADLAFTASLPTAVIGGAGEVAALRRLTGANGAGVVAEHGLMQIPKQALKEGGEEFVQESASQAAQNQAAAETYDPARALLEGAGVAGVHGAVAGGVMGAGTGAMLVPGPSEAEKSAADAAAAANPQQAADRNAAMDELRAAAEQGQQPEQPVQPQNMAQPAPAPQEPASGLSGVVQRAQTSTAPNLATVLSEAIASGQTPDFSALAQAYSRTRAEVVGLFNRRRTLVELADAGDLNGMRDMAARMTADPQEQQSLIEQAVAVRDKRRVMASQPQPTQQAEPQQPATPIKTPRDTAYEKMLADTEASLASGASDVDTFLAVRKKYAGNKDLVDTDINGVIDDAKASLSGKREVAAKREAAIESAIPHLKAGDEVSAVTALADAGITDDADIQAVFKEANSRLKAKPAAAQAKPQQSAQPAVIKSPMEQAVEAVSKAQEGGKGVKLATIAKKYGVGLVDLARQVAAAKTAPINTKQPEERKASPVLALPAPNDAPVQADQPLVSRRGKLLPKAQADAMAEQSAAEKRDMRRAMSEEAGNPTGVPTGMRPRVETPARAPQKAVLPDVILRTDGKPFPNEAEATRAMNRKGAQETHEVAPAPQGNGVVIKRKKANTIDMEKDDILAAIAKAGGVNWDQARKQGGFDQAESGRRGSGILRVFKKNGGMTLDGMAEHLSQFGYPVTDENGDYTVNALLDAMDTALRGGQVGTAQFNERLAREMYEKEAELRALDDALDGGSSSDMPSWLDDGADALADSVIDGETQPSAVLADALNEVENERTIASPAAGTGQKTESGAEAGAGQGSNAPTAGPREGGQQEGQGGAGQDSGAQAGLAGNWIGADRFFETIATEEYGPAPRGEAIGFIKSSPAGTTALETVVRPSGKRVHFLLLSGGSGEYAQDFASPEKTIGSIVASLQKDIDGRKKRFDEQQRKLNDAQANEKAVAERNKYQAGVNLGDITPNTGKMLRASRIVVDNGDGTFDVEGTAGNKTARISGMSASSIERAVKRAKGQDDFSLLGQTEAERFAEEQRRAAMAEAQRKDEESARLKAQADREISSFTLTGSDRPADVAMAAGQKDLFGPRTRGEKEAEKSQPKTDATISDADYAQVVEAAKYLKDIVYSMDNLVGDDTDLLIALSSDLGKSGRDTILMDAFGIDRGLAHTINNRLDDMKPHKLRAVDMGDAFTTFPMLRKVVDDAKDVIRKREERRAARNAESKTVSIRTPGTVKTIIRARNGGRVIDVVSGPHNGTMEDMARVAKAQRRKAMLDHPDAGNGNSITFAEENGSPKWRIGDNGNVSEISQGEADAIASEVSNRDTGDKIESTVNSVMTEVRSMGGDIIGVITDPYSGNRDEIMGIAQSQRSRMFDRYPDASNMQSTTIATDGSGRPAWRVRPNMSGIEQIGQQAKAVAPEVAAIESKPDPVREMTEEGRAKDGKPIIGGDKFRTSSGRETTPYPHQKSEEYASQWLIDNATAEAEARGDDFNAPIFRRTTLLKNGMLTDADRDSMLMYLFGEQPKVVPSILKPLISDLERAQAIVRQPASQPITEQERALLQREAEKQRAAAINLMTAGESMKSAGIEFEEDGPRTRITRNGIPIGSLEGRRDRETVLRVLQRNHGEQPQSAQDNIRPMDSQKKGEGEPLQVSPNKVFTDDAAEKAREILRKALLGNKPMSGMDPELFQAGVTLAGYHIEKGARTFAAYAKAMLSDLGESVRPYLKSWYMGVKYDPRASEMSGMSTASEVDGFDVGSVSIAPAVGIDSLQDYVVSEIEKNIKSLYPDGNAPKSVLEVESTDYSIDLVLQNHPAVRGRRDDPRAYKDFADAAKGIDKGAIREKIIGQREIEPFKAWQPATLKEENREVQGNDQYSGGGQKGDSARHEPSTGQRVVLAEQRGTEPGDGFTVQATGGEVEGDGQGGAGVSGVRPAADGKRGDQQVRGEFGQFQPADGIAGSNGREGGADAGDTRVSVDRAGAQAVVQVAEAARSDSGGLSRPQKLKAQRDAESVEVIPGDKASVDASLPFLLEGQREDVLTAERRFAAPNGHGMLFTNGTGTGKTFLALGVIKRFAKQGKNNILVVVPNDAVIREWEKSAPDLGLTIHQLADTKDAGNGISITTYANFGQNDAVAKRDYDLVVMDEAHNLMQNAQADKTAALSTLRAITLHDQGLRTLTEMQNRPLVDKISALNQQMRDNLTAMKDAPAIKKLALEKANDKIQAELTETHAKLQAAYDANVTKAEKSARPKVLFLSATPFAYEKNIAWAQGYLFDWNEGRPDESQTSRRYNEPDNYEAFMVQHFGYRMRYNKLTEPDAKVDRDLMQREFNSMLKKAGSLSARMLDVPSDYQRAFALTPNSIGTKIDEGMTWLRESNDGKFRPVYDLVVQKFDYLSRQRLLEAMKAEAAIPLIQKWHALGKKVVVFYDFNEGGGFSPFNLGRISEESMEGAEGGQQEIMELVQEFYDARPDLLAINTSDLASPLDALREAFPHAGVYNGQEAKKKRAAAMEAFNDDNNPDANVLIVQSSANAGWSAHDQTGKNKRVLINLGMPTAPTKAIQQEGRIYRQGQNPDSDSMFVYLNTGTSWERIAFANTIARRASTAENLAMGEQARGLRDAFIQAFEDSDTLEPSESEGKGGKEKDRALAKVASPFDRAKTYYYGQLKKTAATKAQEGNDYFATPEPLGMKMVEWLKLDGGERALEPSAGHGAISRWLPDNTENTVVEPSYNLLSRAALNTNAKQVNGRFEDLNLVNKFDGIVMNPPFGSGGRTAIDHLEKAFKHLSDGGRIVAIIPEGPSADQKFDRWYYGTDDKGKQLNPDAVLRAVINLPAVTFERAATTVRTRIVIIDKVKNEDVRKNVPSSRDIDLSQAGDINALFDRLEGLSAPARVPTTPEQAHAEAAPEPQQGALLEPKNTTHAIKKIPLYVAKMTRRVSADSYASLNAVAKRFGGYYSRYEKNGAIPGFQFESEDSRQKFIDAIGDQSQYGTPPSSPTPGVAEVSETGEYITSVGGQNERDTSSVQSRKRAYGSHSAAAHDDLFSASTVPASESEAERNRTDFSKHFSTVSENLEQGRVKSPERITGHKEAAALFARWKDFSQERFLVAGLDANNKVVEVAVHTVGLKASASVDPGTVAGMVARNPSIKSVWLAHNHPSGSSARSAADAQITRAISDLISAAGISVDGHIILGADSYTVLDSDGEALSRIPGMGEFDYQAAPATASVPLVDRMITKRDPGTKITGPDSAKKYVVDRGASGIVLMDTQLNVVGFWEMTLEQMGQMRQNQDSTRSLMAAIDASNAFNAIVSVPDEMAGGGTAWKNVAAMLAASQISVVDAIGYKTGGSYASLGLQVDQKGRKFYSATADTSGPGLTTSRAREILAADPVLSKALPFIDIRNSKDGVPEGAEPFGEEGYYHNGRITLFADNIRATGSMSAEERLKWVAFHEITHRGVANLAESQAYLSELERAGKNPYVKNLAKKIYEARQELDEKYHVSMEVAAEEALAEINAALRTGNVKQIKEQYGLHFPLSIRPRAKSAAARFIEVVKRIINRMFGRGLTDAQIENLLRRTNDSGMTPDGGPGRGRDYDAAVFSLADKGDGSPTEAALAEARRQLDEQLAIADRMIAERGGLFAPNGEKSKLSRYQWAQVRTANFKRWFGDWEGSPANSSKVVDANGEPLVVYHGTTAMGFNEFKPKSAEAYGLGSYFASDRTMPEEEFGVDGRVIEAFLNIRNPSDGGMPKIRKNSEALKKLRQSRPRFRGDEYDAFEEYGDFRGEAIREAGHDGIIAENDEYETELVVFNPSQIKSATGNAGTFSGKTDDIRYSPSPKDWITEQGRITKRVLSKEVAQRDLTLWQKTLGTQLNAALKNPAFKKVYDLTQRLIQHVNNDVYDSLNAAPDVLSRLEDWNDYKRDIANTAKEAGAALTLQQSKRRKDMAAAAEVLFEGTRFDKKVYSDAELDAFKLTADQKEIYRQARAAIDKSVGNAGKSQALNVAMNAEAINWATVERLVNLDLDPEVLFSEVSDLIDTRIAATKMEAENSTNEAEIKKLDKQAEKLAAALASIGEIQAIVEKSATEGYAPLMRWGKYTVAVIDPVDGKTLRFHMLESKREQAALELKLREKYGVANVVGGVLDEGRFEQFKGITPETVALFASVTGMDQDAAYQEYLKLAIPGRSALKRKIHRKGDMGEGIEGFSTDLPRVLSSFVLSNARKSARDLYRGPINDAIKGIKVGGGVAAKARELAEFVLEPDENDWSVGIRNLLFVWNMGASVAFGVLNLSQPWMMTLPWLSQFQDPVSAAGVMAKAAKLAASAQASGKAPKGYEAEYSRAVREGIVDPQNVFMLQGVERGKSGVGTNIWRNVAHGMGLIASATESMNRKLTLIAALDVARAKGDDWLKSKGFADAYDFAARAVAETQGVYNKGNRPAWARNPALAVILVFKQYSINWVEMASRMASNHYGDDRYRKGFWMLIGVLFMMAGGMGLPFADDLIDLIESGMSWAGKPVNVERQMQMALGKDLYEPLMNGPVNSLLFNPMGADMFGRMSMGNMIPATAVANPGLTWAARSDEAVQALGAGAGLASKFVDAYNQAASGNVGQALITASPRAVTSIAKAVEMATTNQYKDSKGRTVRSVTPAEALIKGLDLQPASVARIQRERGRRFKDEAIQAQARTEIRNTLIDAYESGDQDAIDAANNRLRTWNDENPLYPVHINRRALRKTVRERGKNWSARDEAAKGMEWMNDWIPESSK